MTNEVWTQLAQVVGIIWIDIVLSGDNAVVIALACRGLPENRRRLGILLGTGTAIVLRLVFALLVVQLLAVPFLKVVGAALLLWIAVKLLDDRHEDEEVRSTDRLWRAVGTIAMADAVMSLDNVFAIVAVAGESVWLLVFGLAVSIPLIVAGATLVMKLLDRLPILTWAGAALLGWVAGHMLVTDPWVDARTPDVLPLPQSLGLIAFAIPTEVVVSAVGAILVVAVGWLLRRWRAGTASSRERDVQAPQL